MTDAGVITVTCPSCGASVGQGERFCETCGADLPAPAGAPAPAAGGAPPAPADGSPRAADDSPPAADGSPAAPDGSPAAPDGDSTGSGAVPTQPVVTLREGVVVAPVDLSARATTCAACGGTVAPDGYCEQCGTPAADPRDHWVDEPASWVVSVCDRGVRHAHNEDATAVAAGTEPGSVAVLVVCDGVTSAPASDQASLAAARAARDVLAAPAPEPDDLGDTRDHSHDGDGAAAERAMMAAGEAAHAEAAAVARRVAGLGNPPSTTFVAALLEGRDVVVGCVGDSRAYWFPDAGAAEQLSVDDSWAAEAIALGVPREEAENGPNAHAITRWLGADAPDPRPRLTRRRLEGAGWLMLCSDGLWNYCSEASRLGDLLTTTAERVGSAPRPIAEALVTWAVERGGADNITVALARVEA